MDSYSKKLCAMLLCAAVLPVQAQEAEAPAGATPDAASGTRPAGAEDIENVIVTATRRSQQISQVPIAISEVSAQTLEGSVIRDTQSLQMEVPSLNIAVSGSEASGSTLRIRGVGTTGSNAGFESAVGVFVDGVYRQRPGLALNDLYDVQRVEVLRGPQGTLFGKNTSVGTISVITREPVFRPEAELAMDMGDYSSRRGYLMLNTPVWDDKLAVRLSGQYTQRDGYIHNDEDGKDYNDRNRYSLRAQALFQPLPDLSLRVIADRIRKDEHCCAAPYTRYGATAAALAALGGTVYSPPQEYRTAFDAPLYTKTGEDGISGQLKYKLGWADLNATGSYRNAAAQEAADGDYSDVDLARVENRDSNARITTGEVSLHGVYSLLDWVAGVYYSNDYISESQQQLLGPQAAAYLTKLGVPSAYANALYPAGTGYTAYADRQHGKSYSAFTHNVIDLGAGFELVAGLRFLHESKYGGGQINSNSPSCAPGVPAGLPKLLCGRARYRDRYDDDRVTGTASFGKHFANGSYAYLSYASGFKAGGINLSPSSVSTTLDASGHYVGARFKPEEVNSYELGLTLPLLGGRVQTRSALFWMDFNNFQINSYNGLLFIPSNIPSVRSRGVEQEINWRVLGGLLLRGSATYAQARYGEDTGNAALNGKQLTNAPKWTAQLSASYTQPLPWQQMVGFGSIAARYQSWVNTGSDLNPAKAQGGYTLLNARFGIRLPDALELSVWGSNLTDKYYRMITFDAPSQAGSYNAYPGEPRMLGVELRKLF